MWQELPKEQKEEYKSLILAFASLTEAFEQKAVSDETLAPIINSKFQETVFQKAFHATAEDISNSSFDASINAGKVKYLIGIKTFGIHSGDQKIAQFKANRGDWQPLVGKMVSKTNSNHYTKEMIDTINHEAYQELAIKVSNLRNKRIDSSIASLRGFHTSKDDVVESVYHVLMPSKKGEKPQIFVGETSYNKIDIDHLQVLGCTNENNGANFVFTDGVHRYKYTPADCQLSMSFDNTNIVQEAWSVHYVEDAYTIFSELAKKVYGTDKDNPVVTEEYTWSLLNADGEPERYSGLNSFYGTGSKLGTDQRARRIHDLEMQYPAERELFNNGLIAKLKLYLLEPAQTAQEKKEKERLRMDIVANTLVLSNDPDFKNAVIKLLFRPMDEIYIPVPNAKEFHRQHPNFFAPGAGTIGDNGHSLALSKEQRKFNIVFEPSGDVLPAYITQDNGKAIESYEKQSYLGDWILRGVFQLKPFEPLTYDKMKEVGINAIRLYRVSTDNDVHLEFVWKD